MLRILFSLLLLFGIYGTCCGTKHDNVEGSLFTEVESFLDKSSNDSLRSIAESIIYNSSGDDRLALAKALFNSGEKNGDYLRMMYGSSILGANYLIDELNEDSCIFYLNTCLTYKEKIDSIKIKGHRWVAAYACNTLGLFYINRLTDYHKASEYFFQALKLLGEEEYPDLYTIVLANLVVVHYFINDPSGLEYAEMCYDYMLQHKNPFTEFIAEYSMAQMQYISGNYQPAVRSIERAISLMDHPSIASIKYNVATYTLYAKILFAMNMDGKAKDIALQAISLSKDEILPETIDTYLMLGDYHLSRKEFARAIGLYEEAADLCKKGNIKVNLDLVLCKAAEAAELSNQPEKALEYYKEYHSVSRNIFNISKEYALAELKIKYRIEQYENQLKEKQLETMVVDRKRQFWLFLFIATLLTGTGLWIYFMKKKMYDKQMVRQYRETICLNKQLRSMEEMTETNNRHNSSLTKMKCEELYNQLDRLMKEEHIYRDSDITIDKLASMLHTNRTYLSQVINDKTGMNFCRYINRNRMSEAIDRMSDPNENCLLKSLAMDIGFKSSAAFSKAFTEETGVSPSIYRRTALKLDKKDTKQV